MKLVAAMIPLGVIEYEKKEAPTDMSEYSAKIRQMLANHVEVTGIKAMCTLRSLSDPMFWADFGATEPKDLETAAVRKTVELTKILREKLDENEERYARFSERLRELIESFQLGLFDTVKKVEALEALARDIQTEDEAHKGSRLDEGAYGVWSILQKHLGDEVGYGESVAEVTRTITDLEDLAEKIAAVYVSDELAPVRWQEKAQICKGLRSQVRHILLEARVKGWDGIPERVEKFAREHFAKS